MSHKNVHKDIRRPDRCPAAYKGNVVTQDKNTSPFGQGCPLCCCVVKRTYGTVGWGGHEADDGKESRADAPRGLPSLRVVTGDAEADLLIGLKASIWLSATKERKDVRSHLAEWQRGEET